jgi:hypothetical protein
MTGSSYCWTVQAASTFWTGQATPTAENRQTHLLLGPRTVHLLLKELDGTPTDGTVQATPIAETVGQARCTGNTYCNVWIVRAATTVRTVQATPTVCLDSTGNTYCLD